MLLYRYFATHAEETIESGFMKVAKPSELNDPFELMYEVVGKATWQSTEKMLALMLEEPTARVELAEMFGVQTMPQLRKVMKKRKAEIIRGLIAKDEKLSGILHDGTPDRSDQTFRVISFAGPMTEEGDILMWSHYGAKHAGVRVAFDLPDETPAALLLQVQYSKTRVKFDSADFSPEKRRKSIRESLGTKCHVWSYENEFRWLMGPEACTEKTGMDFFPFKRSWIKRVDLGVRYPKGSGRDAFLSLLKTRCPNAEVFETQVARSGYKLDYIKVG